MKVLLVALNSKYIHSNLAVYSLKSYVDSRLKTENGGENCSIETEIAEYTVNQLSEKIMADIFSRGADVLFFSCYIWNIEYVEKLARNIYSVKPKTDIWLGGPEVSFDAEHVMRRMPFLRGVICGEGEEMFLRILRRYADHKEITDESCEIVDISEIPFPYKDLTEFENRIIYYESSRGCPFSCSYCLSSADRRVRLRDMKKVKQELAFFLKNNVPQVKFIDRTFNCNQSHAMEIWEYIAEHDNGVTNFHFEIAGDLSDEDELVILEGMRPGQVQLEIGVQSTNPKVLKEINRLTDMNRLRYNAERLRNANNMHIHMDLIAGLPFEDYESFAASFNDVFYMKPDNLQLGFLKILKGTMMEKNKDKYGIVHTAEPPYEVLATRWISYEELVKLKEIEEMTEVYYNSGQFKHSIGYLLGFFETPFEFFEKLAKWYRDNELYMINISRNGRYESLLSFGKTVTESMDIDETKKAHREFTEAMILDYYLRDNVKTRPKFFGSETVDKNFIKAFYDKEVQEHRYTGEVMCDVRLMRKNTHIEKLNGKYILFDYSRRSPLDNNAAITEIEINSYVNDI